MREDFPSLCRLTGSLLTDTGALVRQIIHKFRLLLHCGQHSSQTQQKGFVFNVDRIATVHYSPLDTFSFHLVLRRSMSNCIIVDNNMLLFSTRNSFSWGAGSRNCTICIQFTSSQNNYLFSCLLLLLQYLCCFVVFKNIVSIPVYRKLHTLEVVLRFPFSALTLLVG